MHVSEALLEYEIGDIANFCAEYDDGHGITFVMDIPYRAFSFKLCFDSISDAATTKRLLLRRSWLRACAEIEGERATTTKD